MNDNEIHVLLETMADEVRDVRPLSHRALRRTRTRRWAIASTVVGTAAIVAVGGAGLALSAGGIGDAPRTAPAGSPDGPPRPMPGTIVAHGESDGGGEWWLSAYENDAGELCVDLEHDDGRLVEDCGAYDPDDVGFHSDDPGGGIEPSAFGWVGESTDKAWVTYGDRAPTFDAGSEDEDDEAGDEGPEEPSSDDSDEGAAGRDVDVTFEGEEPVTLYDAPEGFPFAARFYALLPAPADAHALKIDLRNGDVTVLVVSQPGPATHESDEGRGEIVAEGEHGGYGWRLFERNGDRGRCLDLSWADDSFGSGGGCSTAVPDAESFQYSLLGFGDHAPDPMALFAAVAKDVASMELDLEDGETMPLEIIEGPEGSNVDYVVAWPSLGGRETLRGSVTSRDPNGAVLGLSASAIARSRITSWMQP